MDGSRRPGPDHTDKEGYVTAYAEPERCWKGRLEIAGSVVDESSGSSGTPYNWVRSRRELNTVHRNVAGYTSLVFPSRKLFVINAYSMGAWATGTSTSTAMARIATVKNTGPDPERIVDTLRHFGPRYDYPVTAYPPFREHLRDRLAGEAWFVNSRKDYRLAARVGGERMTEALRDYVGDIFGQVRSGYGASDLAIGMGGETAFSVWLRRLIRRDETVRAAFLGPDELRYNIGDEGTLLSFPKAWRILEDLEPVRPGLPARAEAAARRERMRLPLLFLYGRAGSTISYMGANISPQDVEYGLYEGNPMAELIEGCGPGLDEGGDLAARPVVHVQLRAGARPSPAEADHLAKACQYGGLRHLTSCSRNFAQSVAEDAAAGEISVRLHAHGTGPFAGTGKIKNTCPIRGGA